MFKDYDTIDLFEFKFQKVNPKIIIYIYFFLEKNLFDSKK